MEQTQHYCCVMIPCLISVAGAHFKVLPQGVHLTSMEEVASVFAFNEPRKRLFEGFEKAVHALQYAGCRLVYLDGSFVTNKPVPNDYDGCWDPNGVDLAKLDPVFLDYDDHRAAQKQKYLGEMFIATIGEVSGETFLDFFQTERNTGMKKGILRIETPILQAAP